MTKSFKLVLFCITMPAIAQIYFKQVFIKMTFILQVISRYRIGIKQYRMTLIFIKIPEICLVRGRVTSLQE